MATPLGSGEQESRASTRIEWRVQRAGWIGMALVVALALAGVFGPGPLSWSEASASDGSLTLSYSRFVRNGASSDLTLHIPAGAVQGDVARVSVGGDYLESVEVTSVTPEPESATTTADGVVLTFAVDPGAPVDVQLAATGDAIGFRDAQVEVVGGAPVRFWQLFYP